MAGFDWESAVDVVAKVEEELGELKEALASGSGDGVREELGDLLFAVANVARLSGLDPETALQAANRKFTDRFQRVEEALDRKGLRPSRELREEMERLWEAAKSQSTGST